MAAKDLICKAIKERIVIQFSYDGHTRIVEPFLLGYLSDTDNFVLSAYRVGGYSRTRSSPPWRTFIVAEMSSITLTDMVAQSNRRGYNRRDSRMSRIVCAC